MPYFKGNKRIVIQPNDSNVPYKFNFSNCSSATSNDGFLIYGTNIMSATAITKDSHGNTVTDIVNEAFVSENDVIVVMSYPQTSGFGRYSLTFILTIDDGSTLEANFNRIDVVDL